MYHSEFIIVENKLVIYWVLTNISQLWYDTMDDISKDGHEWFDYTGLIAITHADEYVSEHTYSKLWAEVGPRQWFPQDRGTNDKPKQLNAVQKDNKASPHVEIELSEIASLYITDWFQWRDEFQKRGDLNKIVDRAKQGWN